MSLEQEIRRAAKLILGSKYVVALTGAGISTPSGIPDFRSPESGLWSRVDPMAVASLHSFRLRPQAFYEWARPLAKALLEAQPNPAHRALADLEGMGLLKAIVTQNIDDLHRKAGSKRVLEIHGTLREATCLKCHRVVPTQTKTLSENYESKHKQEECSTPSADGESLRFQGLIERFIETGEPPMCQCGGMLKPNIVLFGEQLPKRILLEAWGEAERCDLMLVVGSSLEMAPASEIPLVAQRYGAKVVIVNYQETYLDDLADVVIREDVAEVLPRIVEACRQGQ